MTSTCSLAWRSRARIQAEAEVTTSKNHFRVRENNGYAAAVKGSHTFAGLRVAATRQGYRPGPYRQTTPYGRGSGHIAAWVV